MSKNTFLNWKRVSYLLSLFMMVSSLAYGQQADQSINIIDFLPSAPPVHAEGLNAPEGTMNEPATPVILPEAQWDLQFEYSVSDSVNYFSNAGAFWTGTEFWVSKWNSDTLARLDSVGSLIEIFTIPGVAGVRSITSDGNNLFLGTANATITEVNATTKTVVSTITITGAGATIGSRFLTYDPTLDSGNGGFYIGNFTSDIAVLSKTGATLSTIPQATHGRTGMYGAAYDGISAGGPYLWVFEQPTSPSNAIISQLELPGGTFTGVSFNVASDLGLNGALAGGLFITSGLVAGENTIGGLAQGTPNVLFGYELDFVPLLVDAQIQSAAPIPGFSAIPLVQAQPISYDADVLSAGTLTLLSARLKAEVSNIGTGATLFSDSSASQTMSSGSIQSFNVGSWTPQDTGLYLVELATSTGSQQDENLSNDSAFFVLEVNDSTLARDQGPIIGNFGVGAGAGQNAALATNFSLPTTDRLTSVSAFFGSPPSGETTAFDIYSVNAITGAPSTLLASTTSYTFTPNDAANGVFITLPVTNQPFGLSLNPGEFVIAVREDGSNIGLSVTGGIFEPGNLWFKANNIGGGAWQSATNQVVLLVRANFSDPISPTIEFVESQVTVAEDTGSFNVFLDIDNPLSSATTVQVTVVDGTAQSGLDYSISFSNPLPFSFPGGSGDSLAIPLNIINDLNIEGQESFQLILSNPSFPAQLGPNDTLTVFIVDDDTNPTLQFATASLPVEEDAGIITVDVEITNPNLQATSVDVILETSSATENDDFTLGTATVTFPPISAVNQQVSVTIIDDFDDEPVEEIKLRLVNPTNGAVITGTDSVSIQIADNDPPLYDIATVTTVDGDGVLDSLGVVCQVRGIVYGVNLSTSGLQFALIDGTGGIQVFSFGPIANYAVNEGDSLIVYGEIDQFNGLAEIVPDTLFVMAQGLPLKQPAIVTTLDEGTENELVRLSCVKLLTPGDWPADGSNANLDVTTGSDTLVIRIDKETNVDGSPVPNGWFEVSGIGGQFDSSSPFTSGYQLFPRSVADVIDLPEPSASFDLASDQLDEGAGTYSFGFTLANLVPDSATISLSVGGGSSATDGTDFTLSPFSSTEAGCGESMMFNGSVDIIDDNDIEGDETIEVVASVAIDGQVVDADTLMITITETDNLFGEIADLGLSLYPNPGTDHLTVSAASAIQQVEVSDLTGRILMASEGNRQELVVKTGELPSGTYLIHVQTQDGRGTLRWIKR